MWNLFRIIDIVDVYVDFTSIVVVDYRQNTKNVAEYTEVIENICIFPSK